MEMTTTEELAPIKQDVKKNKLRDYADIEGTTARSRRLGSSPTTPGPGSTAIGAITIHSTSSTCRASDATGSVIEVKVERCLR